MSRTVFKHDTGMKADLISGNPIQHYDIIDSLSPDCVFVDQWLLGTNGDGVFREPCHGFKGQTFF